MFVLTHVFNDILMTFTKFILTLPNLNLYAGGVSFVFTILIKYKKREINFTTNMSFKDFRTSFGDIISFIDNPIVIVGALGLAKGLFLHYIEGENFFPYLSKYEIALLLLVTFYLLYVSLIELYLNIIDTWWTVSPSPNIPMADTDLSTKNRDVPKPEQLPKY